MSSPIRITTLLLLALLCAACSQMPRVESIEDRVAVGYMGIETLADATATAYHNQWIGREDVKSIRLSLQAAHDALDQVRAYLALKLPDDATELLLQAEAILESLEAMLAEVEP